MDRLALYLTWLSAIGISGTLIIVALSLGYYSVWVIIGCVIVALLIAYPGGKLVASRIKKEDPAWDARRDAPQPDLKRARRSKTDPTE